MRKPKPGDVVVNVAAAKAAAAAKTAANSDAKIRGRDARRLPETEKTLRQFLSLESGNYKTNAMRRTWDRIHGEKHPLEVPEQCAECEYVADTLEDIEWHEEQCGHDGDRFAPKEPAQVVKIKDLWCPHCGGRHHDRGPWAKKNHQTHLCEDCKKTFEDTEKAVGS